MIRARLWKVLGATVLYMLDVFDTGSTNVPDFNRLFKLMSWSAQWTLENNRRAFVPMCVVNLHQGVLCTVV